eukprot:gene13721-16175_t
MVQSFNFEAIKALVRVWRNRSLIVPHLEVRDIRDIEFEALYKMGFRAVLFDKDNTLTEPYKMMVHPPFDDAMRRCTEIFGRDSVAIISNSAGSSDDAPLFKKATVIEESLKVTVLRHGTKKPAGIEAVSSHFGTTPDRIIMIGDRFLTDVLFGNLYGMLTIYTKPITSDALETQHANLDSILNVLDPKLHSLGYLYVLKAKISDNRKNQQTYIAQVIGFFNVCSDQIKVAAAQCNQVSKHLTEILFQLCQPIRGIACLKRVACLLTDKPSQLTAIHADFLQLCILSKSYHLALPIITEVIVDVNPEQTAITIKEVLCYFYYSGIIFTALKRYKNALDAYRQAWTAPATALSAIAIEAYKKYFLVHLLHNGTAPGFPKYTPFVVQRTVKNYCKQYTEFGSAFISNNMQEIQNKAAMNAETFQKDHNFGLVKLAIRSIYKRNIKKLTQTFMTLSIRDIAENVKLPPQEAESIVLKMIEEGEIFASISQKDGMVTFNENPETYKGNKIMNELDSQIQNVMSLETKLRSIDEQFSTSTSYLKRLMSSEKKNNISQYETGMDEIDWDK